MDKKLVKKRRMMGYFIEATNKIIEEEGVESVTIRRVADMAGYNSATLYNYFENLNHLIFYASMKYLKDYAINLYDYTKDSKNSLENYINVWKCFSYFCYKRPEIHHLIFFGDFTSSTVNDAMKEYYSIFPEELGEESQKFLPMLLEDNIHLRDYKLLQACAAEGFFNEDDLHEINEMNVLIYQSMLSRLISKRCNYTVEEAAEKTLKYVHQTLKAYRIDL